MKIRAGDFVVIITGKDKGRTGNVLHVLPMKSRVVVEGLNMRTRHIPKTPQRAGQKIRYEASLHVSNVMLVDPKTKKRTRIGFVLENGVKKRVARRSGEALAGVRADEASKTKETKARGKKASSKKTEEIAEAPAQAIPKKKPFWKRLGFGADALRDEKSENEPKHSQEDHSVPDAMQRQSNRGHQRGS